MLIILALNPGSEYAAKFYMSIDAYNAVGTKR